jgi:peptidoglycan-binding lysM
MPLFGERTKVQQDADKVIGKQENTLGNMNTKGHDSIEGENMMNPSDYRKLRYENEKAAQRAINSDYESQGLDAKGNPYSTVTQEQRTSKKDVLAISNASYGNSLLEKVVNNTNALEYQNAVLKFQQQQVDLLTTIANSIVSIGKVIVTPEAAKQNGDAPEYEKKYSTMAKALGGADLATASTEGLMALWKKVDKNGYFELAKSMVGLVKDMVEDGKIKQIIRDNIKDKMLDILPFGIGQMFREWETDPVQFFQDKIHKMSFSGNKLDRMAAKGFESYNSITYRNTREIKDYSGKAFYSQKTEKTITEIIPEYLAEILAALRKDEAKLWDWKENKFVTRSKLAIQEHKANAQKDYKNSFRENQTDTVDLFEEVIDEWGENSDSLADAVKVLFKPGKNKQGKRVLNNPKLFNAFVKRFTEVYDERAFQALAQKKVDYDAILNKMGYDPIRKEMMRPYLQAFHAIIYRNSQGGTVDLSDLGAALGDYRDNYMEGNLNYTEHHYGEGSLSKGGKDVKKWVNKFLDKAQNLGKEGADIPGLFSRLTMGEQDAIDSAINSENTYINTNVVYINAASVVGAGRGKGRIKVPTGGFTPFTTNKKKYPTAEEIYNSIGEAASFEDDDYANATRGASAGYSFLEGNTKAPGDIEEYAAEKYQAMYTTFNREDLSAIGSEGKRISEMLKNASEELDDNASANDRKRVFDARKQTEIEMHKFTMASEIFGVLSRNGATRAAYNAMDPRERPEIGGKALLDNPSQILPFIKASGGKFETDWDSLSKAYYTYGIANTKIFTDYMDQMRQDSSPDVKGAGAAAAMNMFRVVWQDPRLEGKAGMATGGLLGYMVGNILKQKGIFTSPKAPLMLGGLMAGASMLPVVRKSMEMMFGVESTVKDSNGTTNAQKAMAKIMNVIMPVAAGGAAGAGFYKMMSKLGPAGKAIGIMGFAPVAFMGAAMQKSMGSGLGEWLWGKKDKDDSKFKKFGKLLGSVLPKSFKKFWKARTNDITPATHYANALQAMLPKILAANDKAGPKKRAELEEEFYKVIKELQAMDEDDTDVEKQKAPMESFRRRIRNAIKKYLGPEHEAQLGEWFEAIEQEYDAGVQAAQDRVVDDPELAKQDYVTGADKMINEMQNRIIESGKDSRTIGGQEITGMSSKEQVNDAMKAEFEKNAAKWAQLKESVLDSWKEAKDLGMEGSQLQDIANKRDKYLAALKGDDPVEKAAAANEFLNAYMGVPPESYSVMKHKLHGLSQLRSEVYTMGSNILKDGEPFTEAEQKYFNNWLKTNIPDLYEMVAGKTYKNTTAENITDNIKNLFKNKQVRIDEQSAADFIGSVDGWNNLASQILDSGNYVNYVNGVTRRGEDDKRVTGQKTAEEMKKVRDFIAKAAAAPDDNITTGQGYRGVKSDRYIPEAYLNIRAVSSKNVWGMNDFADISIAGKSGSLVGCSVATMNNILHYLGIKEISQNSLAVHANRHSNSSGVKYSFFSTIANDLGLHYRILTAKANIFNETFFKDNGDDCAYAVLLNNYNGTGHFVFCAKPTKDGTITMIDPMGKGRKEKVSISDITLRATIIVQIAKGRLRSRPGNAAASNWISKTTGKVTDFGMMSDIVDEDDGIFSGMGRRRAKMGSRKRARREKSAADNIRNVTGILQNDTQRAGLKQVLEDLYSKMEEGQDKEDMSALIATLGLSMVSGANDKKHAKRIISLLRRIDKGSGKYTSVLNQLMNSKETTDAQEEQNKQEANIEAIKENTANTAENTQGGNANGNNGTTKAAGQSKKGLLKSLFGLGAGLIPKLLVSALGMGIAWKGLGFAGKIFGTGFKQFNRNTLHNILEDEREQTIDPETGEVVDNGHFRDYSKAINGTRSLIRWGKMALPVAKYSAKLGIKSAMYSIKHVGKIASTAGKLVGADKIVKGLMTALGKFKNLLLDPNGKIGKFIIDKGWNKAIEPVINAISKLFKRKAGNVAKKAAQEGAKKGFGSFLKKLPGIGLIWNLGQAAVSLWQGYKHAGQLLKVNEDIVPTGTRIMTAFAKMMYDVGPELLLNMLKLTPAGFLGFSAEVLIEVLRLIFTWDDLVEFFGIGKSLREAKTDANRDEQKAARLEKNLDKETKEENEKMEGDSKEADPKNNGREKVAEGTVSTLTSYRSPSGSDRGGSAVSNAYGSSGSSNVNTPSSYTSLALGGSNNQYGTSGYAGGIGSISIGKYTLTDDVAVSVQVTKIDGKTAAVYTRIDGSTYTKVGGHPNWRYNNPGNIMVNDRNRNFIKNTLGGYIGEAPNAAGGMFAIFASEAAGYKAMIKNVLLSKIYKDPKYNRVSTMFLKYAPKGHGANDPIQYGRQAVAAVGADPLLSELSEDQKNRLFAFILTKEGMKQGKIIGDVRKGNAIEVNGGVSAPTSTVNTTSSTTTSAAATTTDTKAATTAAATTNILTAGNQSDSLWNRTKGGISAGKTTDAASTNKAATATVKSSSTLPAGFTIGEDGKVKMGGSQTSQNSNVKIGADGKVQMPNSVSVQNKAAGTYKEEPKKPVTPATRSGSDRTAIYDAPIKSQSSTTKSGSEASAIMEALTKGAANQTQAIVVGLDQIYKSINKLIDVVKSNNTSTMRDAASTAGR